MPYSFAFASASVVVEFLLVGIKFFSVGLTSWYEALMAQAGA